MNNSFMDTSDSSPIDLSRRCDSVETRKTPSPYNSSTFAETSPSLENDSPTSRKKTMMRSDTPTNCYQSSDYVKREFRSPSATSHFPFNSMKNSPPSPPNALQQYYMREQSINSNDDEIKPSFIMQAVALQQKLQSLPASVSASVPSSPESGSSSQYPMMLGRGDSKMTRPFKAYPRDPLSNPFASIPTADAIGDRMSADRYSVYRQQMLEQIHAANGGRPTVTNPKMRRTSAKTFSESETNAERAFAQQSMEMANQSDDSETGSQGNAKKGHKDGAYFERRRKNNAAAKKSRDRRRMKEDEIAIRASYLERENMELKIELATIKRQLSQFIGT